MAAGTEVFAVPDAMMLPGVRIIDVQSNADNLLLETFLSVSDMSGPAQILGSQSRSAGHELLLLSWAAALPSGARSPAIQIHASDTRSHVCDIVQSIQTGVLVRQRPKA